MKAKIALVGVNGYGETHLAELLALEAAGRIEFVAAVIINPAEAAAEEAELRNLGVRIFRSTGAMWQIFSGRLDLVCLPVGIVAHEALTCEALRHGANVLLEKPAAGSVAAVDKMIAARDAAGKFVAVGFQRFYQPETIAMRRLIEDGLLGEIRRVAVRGIWPRADAYYRRNNWAGKAAVNGVAVHDSPFCNGFAHFVNLALCFSAAPGEATDRVCDVQAVLRRARPEIEMFDNCAANFKTVSGALLSFGFSHTSSEYRAPDFRVEGTRGVLKWQGDFEAMCFQAMTHDGKWIASGEITTSRSAMFASVLDALRHPGARLCTLEIAREHVRAVEMLHSRAVIETLPEEACTVQGEDGQYVLKHAVEKTLGSFFDDGILPERF